MNSVAPYRRIPSRLEAVYSVLRHCQCSRQLGISQSSMRQLILIPLEARIRFDQDFMSDFDMNLREADLPMQTQLQAALS